MNYALIWPDAMINEMARQYVRAHYAGFGSAFSQAIHRIEARLSTDPFLDTESRGLDIRVVIEAPVTLYYRIESDPMRVTVMGLLFSQPRSR